MERRSHFCTYGDRTASESHRRNNTKFCMNISQYKISIAGKPLNEYLKSLKDADYKKQIISRTLCDAKSRANSHELLAIVSQYNPHFERSHLQMQSLVRAGEATSLHMGNEPQLGARRAVPRGLCERVVRVIRVRDNAGDLRDVYRAPHDTYPYISECVSHERLGHTTRVFGEKGPDGKCVDWLIALSRSGGEWRETQRLQTDAFGYTCCALSDSRVLVGGVRSLSLDVNGAVPSGERPDSHCAPLPHRRARRVQAVSRDERQRHTRGDVPRRLTYRCGDCAATGSRNSRASD